MIAIGVKVGRRRFFSAASDLPRESKSESKSQKMYSESESESESKLAIAIGVEVGRRRFFLINNLNLLV